MKLRALLLALTMAAQTLTTRAAEASGKVEAVGARPWVEVNFPIIAWNILTPAHTPASKSESLYEDLADAGYNVAGFVTREDLSRAKEAGIKAILFDPKFWELAKSPITPAERTEQYAALLPAEREPLIGVYIVDEPNASALRPAGNAVQALHAAAPDLWPFISFFPIYVDPQALGFSQYASYVKAAFTKVGAWNFSGCFYGLMEDGTTRDGYWRQLRLLRDLSVENNKPFFQFVLTTPHFRYREPSVADLAFTTFSGLAYGAKGLIHFTAVGPSVGNYRLAPIDQFGNRTPTFHAVQNLNKMVSVLGPTLLGLKSQRVYFTGRPPEGEPSVSDDSFVKSVDFDALVGDFVDAAGVRYALITNLNLKGSERCDPVITDGSAPEFLCPFFGVWKSYAGEQMWLAPGHGVLLRLAEKQ